MIFTKLHLCQGIDRAEVSVLAGEEGTAHLFIMVSGEAHGTVTFTGTREELLALLERARASVEAVADAVIEAAA